MKRYILLLGIIIITLASCTNDTPFDAAKQARLDDSTIRVYLAANPTIKAVKDSSGLYYQVINPGKGANPTAESTVTVNYAGKLLNGSEFDSGKGFTSPLAGLIPGWQAGIPHVKPGGRILLIIPSAMGYANNEAGSIPPNSVLLFDIDLISFK